MIAKPDELTARQNDFPLGAVTYKKTAKGYSHPDAETPQSPIFSKGMTARAGGIVALALAAATSLLANNKGLETQAAADPTATSRNASISEMVPSADGQSFVTAARWDNPELPLPARAMTRQNQKLEK